MARGTRPRQRLVLPSLLGHLQVNDVNQRCASSWKTMCLEIERERPGESKSNIRRCGCESSTSPTASLPTSPDWTPTRRHKCFEFSTNGNRHPSRGPSTRTGAAISSGTWSPTRRHSPIGSSRSPIASTSTSFVATPNARRLSTTVIDSGKYPTTTGSTNNTADTRAFDALRVTGHMRFAITPQLSTHRHSSQHKRHWS